MKKFMALFLALLTAMSLFACGKKTEKMVELNKEFECGAAFNGTATEGTDMSIEQINKEDRTDIAEKAATVTENYALYQVTITKEGGEGYVESGKFTFKIGEMNPEKIGVYRVLNTVDGIELKMEKSEVDASTGTVTITPKNCDLRTVIVCETENKIVESTTSDDPVGTETDDVKENEAGSTDSASKQPEKNTSGNSSGTSSSTKTPSSSTPSGSSNSSGSSGSGTTSKPTPETPSGSGSSSGSTGSTGSSESSGSGGQTSGTTPSTSPAEEPKADKWVYDEHLTNVLKEYYGVGEPDKSYYCSEEAGKKFNALGKQYVNGEVTAEYVKSELLNTQIRPIMTDPYNYAVASVSNVYVEPCNSDKEFRDKAFSQIEACGRRRYGFIEVYRNESSGQCHVYAIFAGGKTNVIYS